MKSKAALSIYVQSGPKRPDEDCISGLQEDLPVELLFQEEVLQEPTTKFPILQDNLVLKGFNFEIASG